MRLNVNHIYLQNLRYHQYLNVFTMEALWSISGFTCIWLNTPFNFSVDVWFFFAFFFFFALSLLIC